MNFGNLCHDRKRNGICNLRKLCVITCNKLLEFKYRYLYTFIYNYNITDFYTLELGILIKYFF